MYRKQILLAKFLFILLHDYDTKEKKRLPTTNQTNLSGYIFVDSSSFLFLFSFLFSVHGTNSRDLFCNSIYCCICLFFSSASFLFLSISSFLIRSSSI